MVRGSGMEITGQSTLHGDLKVEGWLEAPNIKGFLRGLYPTPEALERALPRPLGGWAALVGKSLPAHVYVAADGVWERTGELGGAPLLCDNVKISDSPALDQEKILRRLGDEALWIGLGYLGLTKPDIDWILGKYVAQTNHILEKEGYMMSSPIHLNPGEEIIVRCDTRGEVNPISLTATDQTEGWYDFPAIGDVGKSGVRVYSFFADEGGDVVISSAGEPESIILFSPKDSLRVQMLHTAAGGVASATRRQGGGKLSGDGSVSNTPGFGITRSLRRGSLRMIHYRGYMEEVEHESRVMVLFRKGDGTILQTHYTGGGNNTPSGGIKHAGGGLDLWLTIPEQCELMSFCHQFHPSAPRFLVTGF